MTQSFTRAIGPPPGPCNYTCESLSHPWSSAGFFLAVFISRIKDKKLNDIKLLFDRASMRPPKYRPKPQDSSWRQRPTPRSAARWTRGGCRGSSCWPQGPRGGCTRRWWCWPPAWGGAIRFTKILSDFCSRCLIHIILHLKRPGKSIRSKKWKLSGRKEGHFVY